MMGARRGCLTRFLCHISVDSEDPWRSCPPSIYHQIGDYGGRTIEKVHCDPVRITYSEVRNPLIASVNRDSELGIDDREVLNREPRFLELELNCIPPCFPCLSRLPPGRRLFLYGYPPVYPYPFSVSDQDLRPCLDDQHLV